MHSHHHCCPAAVAALTQGDAKACFEEYHLFVTAYVLCSHYSFQSDCHIATTTSQQAEPSPALTLLHGSCLPLQLVHCSLAVPVLMLLLCLWLFARQGRWFAPGSAVWGLPRSSTLQWRSPWRETTDDARCLQNIHSY